MKRYHTIVADPPWDHADGTGQSFGDDDHRGGRRGAPRRTTVPYRTMSTAAIVALPVNDLALDDAHLYLWTTNRYLRSSYEVAEAWGFSVRMTLTWCKKPMGFFGRPFYGNSLEFIQFCTRGRVEPQAQVAGRWFTWPRGRHSQKPDAFLDMVEQVSPGPYLELFARRDRLGWDTWGNECLGTAEVAA